MKRERIQAAFKQVAEENGVSLENVMQEIDRVIQEGVHSGDAQIRKRWATIPSAGEVPTAIELTEYLLDQLQERRVL